MERISKPIFVCASFLLIIYLIWPAMAGKPRGASIGHSTPEEYKKIEKFIKAQRVNFRTFWRPIEGRFAFYSQEFPLFSMYYTSDLTRFFFGENWNSQAFSSKNIAKLLGLLNIKYCFIPLEEESQKIIPGRDKAFYISTFQEKVGLEEIHLEDDIHIFENKYFVPRLFASDQATLVVGSRKALLDIADFKGVDLSCLVVFFSDELKSKTKNLLSGADSLIFYDAEINDLVLNSLPNENRFDLSQYAGRADESITSRWQKINIPPLDFYGYLYGLIAQNPNGAIYAPNGWISNLIHPVEVNIEESGFYEVWIRAMRGPDMGILSIWTSKNPRTADSPINILREKNLKDNNYYFQWIKAKMIYLDKGRHFFDIINDKIGKNILDQFVVVPKKHINVLYQNVLESLKSKDIVIFKNCNNQDIDFSIPTDGRYHISAKMDANNFSGNIDILLNNHIFKTLYLNTSKKSISTEFIEFSLKKGVNKICLLKYGEGMINLEKIILYKTDETISSIEELFMKGKRIPVEWVNINPTRYSVKLKTKNQIYLVLSEPFDPRWTLNLKNPVPSISAYSMINSFFIANPEDIETTIEFTPQKYIYRGIWFSGIGLASICYYLFFISIKSLKKRRTRGKNLG